MWKLMLLVVLIAVGLAGCAPFPPHREITAGPSSHCAQFYREARKLVKTQAAMRAKSGASALAADPVRYDNPKQAPCWRSSPEQTDDYDLFFVEFGDHEWLGGVDEDQAKRARVCAGTKHQIA